MFNARDRLARGIGASSNVLDSSHDSPFKMSRIRGRGKQRDDIADVKAQGSVSFMQIESNSRGVDIGTRSDLKVRIPSPPKKIAEIFCFIAQSQCRCDRDCVDWCNATRGPRYWRRSKRKVSASLKECYVPKIGPYSHLIPIHRTAEIFSLPTRMWKL